jgi:hypothetical protein
MERCSAVRCYISPCSTHSPALGIAPGVMAGTYVKVVARAFWNVDGNACMPSQCPSGCHLLTTLTPRSHALSCKHYLRFIVWAATRVSTWCICRIHDSREEHQPVGMRCTRPLVCGLQCDHIQLKSPVHRISGAISPAAGGAPAALGGLQCGCESA